MTCLAENNKTILHVCATSIGYQLQLKLVLKATLDDVDNERTRN